MNDHVLFDLEAERAALGAVLLVPAVLERLLVEDSLRPEHFYREQHRLVFAAMVQLHDENRQVDWLTVAAELERVGSLEAAGGRAEIDGLTAAAPAAGNGSEYARIVVDFAAWRARRMAVLMMDGACADRDQKAFDTAEAMLTGSDRPDDTTSDPQALGHDALEWFSADSSGAIPLPFHELTEGLAGGFRPGDVTVVAGWSSMGKSVLVDDLLKHATGAGFRAHGYINEMSRRERSLRNIADLSGVPFNKIMARDVKDQRMDAVVKAASRLPFGLTDCSGWSAHDIARHVRRHRWDIAAVDLLNLIPHRGTEDVDAISSTLNTAARQSGCHLLVVCQLNQERNKTNILPRPVRRDIRESGQIANDAANVMFVHREMEEVTMAGTGDGTGVFTFALDGAVWFDKVRNGEHRAATVRLDPRRMSFREQGGLRAVA